MEEDKAKQRVAIAKDVLAQLAVGRLNPQGGVYFRADLYDRLKDVPDNSQVNNILKQVPTCRVCALGGLFVAAVERHNDLKYNETWFGIKTHFDSEGMFIGFGDIDMRKYLGRFFSEEQLRLIEAAFESWIPKKNGLHNGDGPCANWATEATFRFNRGKDGLFTVRERMERIMRNIVRHEGEFVPEDVYDPPL